MGILNLKNKTVHKFIKNQRKAAPITKEINVKVINKVGVLSEVSLFQTYDFTKRLSEGLKIGTEDLKVILFDPTGKETAVEKFRTFNEKDFGFHAKVKSEIVNKFVNTNFDLLINYCDPELLFPKVVVLRSKAQLKAGFENESNFFNDISIKTTGNDIDTFNEELVKYLQILKLVK